METKNSTAKWTSQRQLESPFQPYLHLLGFAFGYSVLTFCCTGIPQAAVMVMPVIAGIISTVVLVGLWSVFGPGTYLRRLFWSHLIGVIPAAGFCLAVLCLSIGETSFEEFIFWTLTGLISFIPISLGAQIPLWFFRGLFGWQFVYKNQKPAPAFGLRDIFVVTFVFALCFAVPQIMINLQSRVFDQQFPVGAVGTTTSLPVTQPDGSVVMEVQEVTDKDVEQLRRDQAQMIRMGAFAGYGYVLFLSFIAAMFSLPILIFVFRMGNGLMGCGLTVAYAIGLLCLAASINMIFSGGNANVEGLFYFGCTLALCAACISLPMLVSRKTGFRLTSPKRFVREQIESGLADPIETTEVDDDYPPTDPIDPLA